MSRWALYRERGQRKRKVLLLLTLSGVIRPADVEQRYFGERTTGAHQSEPSSTADSIPGAGTSQKASAISRIEPDGGFMRSRKPWCRPRLRRPRSCEVYCYRHGCDPPEPESLLPDCTTPLTHHRTRPRNVTSPLTFHFHFFHHLLFQRRGVNCVVWDSVLFRLGKPTMKYG